MDGSQEVACLSTISSCLSQASKIGRTAQHPAKRILCLRLVQRLAIACRGVVELPIPCEEPPADTKQFRPPPRLACLQTVRERLVDCCEPFDKLAGLGKSFAERTQKNRVIEEAASLQLAERLVEPAHAIAGVAPRYLQLCVVTFRVSMPNVQRIRPRVDIE